MLATIGELDVEVDFVLQAKRTAERPRAKLSTRAMRTKK
jgi:hypothetical protein